MRPLLVLLLIAVLAQPTVAADSWWAIAASIGDYGITTYGAAWNYPTLEQAGAAAEGECRNQVQRRRPFHRTDCIPKHSGKNSCFFVMGREMKYQRQFVDHGASLRGGTGLVWKQVHITFFYVGRDYQSKAEAEAESRRWLKPDEPRPGFITLRKYIDLLACSGVE